MRHLTDEACRWATWLLSLAPMVALLIAWTLVFFVVVIPLAYMGWRRPAELMLVAGKRVESWYAAQLPGGG